MNQTINYKTSEEEAAEERQRTVEMENGRHSRKCCFFSPFKYMALLLEIVPSAIAILLGIWLLSATVDNSNLPTSEQVHFIKPYITYETNLFFTILCRPRTIYTAENGTKYCERFVKFPLSDIGNGTFYTMGAAMILFGVARIVTMINLYRKFPIPNPEVFTSSPFCHWCAIFSACLVYEMIGLHLIHVMRYSIESEPLYMDFTFINDKHDQFYYMFNSLSLYYTYNYPCMILSKFAIIFAHLCA